jgi:hypothetical protein
MQVTTAVELIHSLIFFPGFEFKAHDHTDRFEGTVKVRIEYDAWNTNRQTLDDDQYTEKIKTYAEFPLMVEDIQDEAVLYRRLMTVLMRLYQHEAREALRVRGTLWSPFHPHRLGGMRRWRQTSEEDLLSDALMMDFTFGVC